MNERPKRRGRPSKGEREHVKGAVPKQLARRFKADADQAGLSDSDYLARLIQEYYELKAVLSVA